jgi:hypothetical protein
VLAHKKQNTPVYALPMVKNCGKPVQASPNPKF